jgi:hypothetical protein
VTKTALWSVLIFLFCSFRADAQTIVSAPFICQWANIQGGCPGNGWEQGFPEASSPADDNCGPTSVLMVASKYSGTTPIADQISQIDDWLAITFGSTWGYSANNGKGSGTEAPELVSLARNYFGLTDSAGFSGWTIDQLKQELARGYPVIVRVRPQMVASYPDAHYMVLLGMDSESVYVNDPGIRRGGQAKYKLQDFINAWAQTATWDHQNNEGVVIHPAPSQTVAFLSFTEGNPGLPGDGVFVNAGGPFQVSFDLQTPFSLSGVTNGITVTVFPPSNIQNFQSISLGLVPSSGNLLCSANLGAGTIGKVSLNGVVGYFNNILESDLNFAVNAINSFNPSCGVTLNNLRITQIFVFGFGGFITTLDAASMGIGQNAFPGTQIQ